MPMPSERRHLSRRWIAALVAGLAMVAAACSASGGASSAAVESATSVASSAPPSATPVASGESGGGRGDYDYETTPSDAPAGSAAGSPTASSATGDVTVNVAGGPLGDYLTGVGNLTLYTFKPDSPETSTCDGGCAGAWPPFTVETGVEPAAGDGVEGTLSTFARTDGTLQVAYNGAPLYYFANDSTPGDTNGQGLGDNWFIVKP